MNINYIQPGPVYIPAPPMAKTRQKKDAECPVCADYGYVPTKNGEIVKCEFCHG